jgi:hypothetical protein
MVGKDGCVRYFFSFALELKLLKKQRKYITIVLPYFIPPIAPQSPSHIIWGWYNRPVVAAVPSGLSLTPLRIIKKK